MQLVGLVGCGNGRAGMRARGEGAQGPGEQRGEAREIREPAQEAAKSSSCLHIPGFSAGAEVGEEEDGQVRKQGSLPHRGLGAWFSLKGQLVELILRLILIQRHLQHTGLITPTGPCCSQEPAAQSPRSQCPPRGHRAAPSLVQKLDSGQRPALDTPQQPPASLAQTRTPAWP